MSLAIKFCALTSLLLIGSTSHAYDAAADPEYSTLPKVTSYAELNLGSKVPEKDQQEEAQAVFSLFSEVVPEFRTVV